MKKKKRKREEPFTPASWHGQGKERRCGRAVSLLPFRKGGKKSRVLGEGGKEKVLYTMARRKLWPKEEGGGKGEKHRKPLSRLVTEKDKLRKNSKSGEKKGEGSRWRSTRCPAGYHQ